MGDERLKNAVRRLVPRELRNWLRSPSKSMQWLWNSARFALGQIRTLQIAPNLSLRCHPNAFRIYRELQIGDAEQREEFHNFLSYCSREMFLFDIGAHFGPFSLGAAHLGGRAIAVDPSPTAARMIALQAALNGLSSEIHVVQAAVNDTNGTVGMLSAGVFTAGYFRFARGRLQSDLRPARAVTIDELAKEFGTPTHIKIDVEGHEAAVLRGAHSTLTAFSPVLFLELHNEMVAADGGDPNAALLELAMLNYETFTVDGKAINSKAILDKPIIRVIGKRS